MKEKEFDKAFGSYIPPTQEKEFKMKGIQLLVLQLAESIDGLCPDSREKSKALTDLQGVKMWANAAIALHD